MATSPLSSDDAEQKYQDALNELMQRLDSRKNRLFDPTMLAMAQGFLTPGRTGSFGEALGNVAQRVGDVQRQEEREDVDLARMRLELAKTGREAAQKRDVGSLLGQLYQETESGYEPRPEIAQKLAGLTGDPRYQELLVKSARERKIGEQLEDLFVKTDTGYAPNVDAMKRLSRITGDPKYSKMLMDAVEEQSIKDSISNLYTPDGKLNPDAARKFAVATKNPAMLQTLSEVQKAERLREAGQNILQTQTDADGKIIYRVDTNALMAAAKASDDPAKTLASYAELIPKLRKAGMVKDLGGDVTSPFDAIVLMTDSMGPTGAAYKAQAQRLARQYQTGMIDEDKANTLANQMMTAINSSVDRATALQNTKIMQEFQRQIAMSQQALERDRFLDRQSENAKKLTEEQKLTYSKLVLPIINQGLQADTALMQLEPIRQLFENAPSGVLGGAFAVSVGRLFGTDANTALKELRAATKGLVPLIPRLPGAASNLDAQKLEESLGQLDDPMLTNEARKRLLNTVADRFKNLSARAAAIQFHWDEHKRYDPKVLDRKLPGEEGAPAGTPRAAPGTSPAGAPVLRWNPATKRFE